MRAKALAVANAYLPPKRANNTIPRRVTSPCYALPSCRYHAAPGRRTVYRPSLLTAWGTAYIRTRYGNNTAGLLGILVGVRRRRAVPFNATYLACRALTTTYLSH